MEVSRAARLFAALGQETRLAAVRALAAADADGLASGRLAALLKVPANTLSAHLGILVGAGLVSSERRGTSIVYRAVPDVRALVSEALFGE
ncbi:ArsR/SmtB family transcription factor [Sphingomonas guangdongensis]|nr:metalloregulator ArsR/SmtB family transcription factor [Sphingomonas guangdongensis]